MRVEKTNSQEERFQIIYVDTLLSKGGTRFPLLKCELCRGTSSKEVVLESGGDEEGGGAGKEM